MKQIPKKLEPGTKILFRVEVKILRRGGFWKWTNSVHYDTWTAARLVALDWERQGHQVRVQCTTVRDPEQLSLALARRSE